MHPSVGPITSNMPELMPKNYSGSKKVQILEPSTQDDSDDESQPITAPSISSENNVSIPQTAPPPGDVSAANNVLGTASGTKSSASVAVGATNTPPQPVPDAASEQKKTKEERKMEREKKKNEEMLKKYKAEQEAKQKAAAKSKCGRWIKHNIKIGEGGYKFVYRGYDCIEARNIAWCEFKPEHVDTKEKRLAMFRETEIMLTLNNSHIVQCFDVFSNWTNEESPDNPIEVKGIVIIQELMSEGTLKSVIKKNYLHGQCILKFPLITRWWHQILDALRYMHHRLQQPILHRDLKAENCFLYGASDEEYLNVKVGDFGLATHVGNSGRKTMLGTVGFMAPEIFDEKYDEKVDIYAFGMLMLEVMTNRTPYDECDTMIQVAAKTLSGHGPEIMQKITNASLHMVISACIHPLACYRPTAEELYFHPVFQRYQDGDDSWQTKTLPVEVEPNYDKASDRTEVIERFVRSLANPETRNPNFNLRLRFRDRKMLQELGLDDGESLEFDLDIYKAEDQDIPDLINSLRQDYEDKLSRVYVNPKQPDKKIVSNHLDKLFMSIRLQMQFLVKCLLGKRWKDILDTLVSAEKRPKGATGGAGSQATGGGGGTGTGPGPGNGNAGGGAFVGVGESDEESSDDDDDFSNFAIVGKYKAKWLKAKKHLDREIQAYRNAAAKTSVDRSAAAQAAAARTSASAAALPEAPAPANPKAVQQPSAPAGSPSPSVLNAPDLRPPTPPPSQLQHPIPGTGVAVGSGEHMEELVPISSVVTQSIQIQQDPCAPASGQIGGNPVPPGMITMYTSPQMPANVIGQQQPLRSTNQPPPPLPLLQGGSVQSAGVQQLQGLPNTPPVGLGGQLMVPVGLYRPNTIPATDPSGLPAGVFASAQPHAAPPGPQTQLIDLLPGGGGGGQVPNQHPGGQHAFYAQPPPAPPPPPPPHPTAAVKPHDAVHPANQTMYPNVPHNRFGDEFGIDREQTSDPEAAEGAQLQGQQQQQQLQGQQQQQPIKRKLSQKSAPAASAAAGATPGAAAAAAAGVVMQQQQHQTLPPRYILRITQLELESEGCDVPGTLRPTFYLEMPDVNNPNCELWKLSFRCNLSDTTDDIKLFEGRGYTQTNEEIDHAIKEAVATILRALQFDEKSIALNHDYVFYPHLSPELVAISQRCRGGFSGDPLNEEVTMEPKEEAGVPGSVPTHAVIECATEFGSQNEEDLSDTTPSADSPTDRSGGQGGGSAAAVATAIAAGSALNIRPALYQQQQSYSPYLKPEEVYHPGLEELPPLEPHQRLPPNAATVSVSHPLEVVAPIDTKYDSTESLPVYSSAYPQHSILAGKEPDAFVTLKMPAHAQSLMVQIANYLTLSAAPHTRPANPMLIVPGDAGSQGHMFVLPEQTSFLCSRNAGGGGLDGGLSVQPLPPSRSVVVVQEESALGAQTRIFRPPENGSIVITADEEVHFIQKPTVLLPASPQRPLVEVPLSAADGVTMTFDDLLQLMMTLRGSLGEGVAPVVPSPPQQQLPRHHSTAEAINPPLQHQQQQQQQQQQAGGPQLLHQQDANYYSLPYGSLPIGFSRAGASLAAAAAISSIPQQQLPAIYNMAPTPRQPPNLYRHSVVTGGLMAQPSVVPPAGSGYARTPATLPPQPIRQTLMNPQQTSQPPPPNLLQMPQQQALNPVAQLNPEYLAAILSVNPALLNFAGGVVGGNPLWTTNSPTTSLQPTSSSSIPPSTVQPSQKQHQQHPLASQTAPAGAVSQLSQLLLQAAMMQQQPPAAPAVPGLGGPVSTSSIISGAVYGAAAPPTTSTSVAAAPYVVPQDINSTMAFDSSMSYMQPMGGNSSLGSTAACIQSLAQMQPYAYPGSQQQALSQTQQPPFMQSIPSTGNRFPAPPPLGQASATPQPPPQVAMKPPPVPQVPAAPPVAPAPAALPPLQPVVQQQQQQPLQQSKFLVTPSLSQPGSLTSHPSAETCPDHDTTVSAPLPPGPLPSPTAQTPVSVIGNKFTVISAPDPSAMGAVAGGGPSQAAAASTESLPFNHRPQNPQTPPKKIPPKFTVATVDGDMNEHQYHQRQSPPNSPTDAATHAIIESVLLHSPPSETDVPTQCPPPPSTPAMSNQASAIDLPPSQPPPPPSPSSIPSTSTVLSP